MAIVIEQMPASQAPFKSIIIHETGAEALRTWQEATHKALRCGLLGQQKPFPQHNQQGSTPAEAAARHNNSQSHTA